MFDDSISHLKMYQLMDDSLVSGSDGEGGTYFTENEKSAFSEFLKIVESPEVLPITTEKTDLGGGEVLFQHTRDDNVSSQEVNAFVIQNPEYMIENPDMQRPLDFLNELGLYRGEATSREDDYITHYLPYTGTLNNTAEFGADAELERLRLFTNTILSARVQDRVAIEVLPAGEDLELGLGFLDEYSEAKAAIGLQKEDGPALEAWLSGFYPHGDTSLGQAAIQKRADLKKLEGDGRLVMDPLSMAEELQSIVNKVAARDEVAAVVVDDHFAIPQNVQEEFFARHQREIPPGVTNEDWARTQMGKLFSGFAQAIRAQDKEVVLSIGGPFDFAERNLQDPVAWIKAGNVDHLEVQLYRPDNASFASSLETLVSQIEQLHNNSEINNLQSVRVAVTRDINGHALTPAELYDQQEIVEAFSERLKQNTGLTLNLSVFDTIEYRRHVNGEG